MRAVMRSPSFQRPMRALALMAVLLLALMPSATRLVAARSHAHAGWAQLCTVTGLKLVQLSPDTPDERDAAGHAQGDCDYCPLLASLSAPDAGPQPLLAALPPAAAPALRASQRPPALHTAGLGSRGPPPLA
jgi:hypothetical protein